MTAARDSGSAPVRPVERATVPERRPEAPDRVPTAFRFWEHDRTPRAHRVDAWLRRRGFGGVFPTGAQARAFTGDLFATDTVAERFVDEVFEGPVGRARGREMLDTALGAGGLDAVTGAPPAMRALFAEFESVPAWVDPELVEQGAAIWRRWGTMLFSVAGATTLEMYTEAAVALPLSLTGGCAGDNAMRRFLETARFWIDVSEPGALLRRGSDGRATAMRVRVMHVAVRRRVAGHDEWDTERWGAPISQAYQALTLLGGSVAPALALWPLGHLTTAAEMRALLHFQRYLGHLLGVQPAWFPDTVADAVRLLFMTMASRAHDAGEHGAELIESFPAGFAPRGDETGVRRWRAAYTYRVYSAYARLWMAGPTHRRHRMPPAMPWLLVPLTRAPLVAAAEIVGHGVPLVRRALERHGSRYRERWYRTHLAGRAATFEATSDLRR